MSDTHTHFMTDDWMVLKRCSFEGELIEVPYCLKCASVCCPIPLYEIPSDRFGFSRSMIIEK